MCSSIYDQLYLYYDVDGRFTMSMKGLGFLRAGFLFHFTSGFDWTEEDTYTYMGGLLCHRAEHRKARLDYTNRRRQKVWWPYSTSAMLCGS